MSKKEKIKLLILGILMTLNFTIYGNAKLGGNYTAHIDSVMWVIGLAGIFYSSFLSLPLAIIRFKGYPYKVRYYKIFILLAIIINVLFLLMAFVIY
ncbi:MAG: hypothetical protein COB85_00130 [Bacteroidetes bacterium]|nr:MAG: hypothetical protein COB85_00130 [Bacteroidota bacterium]